MCSEGESIADSCHGGDDVGAGAQVSDATEELERVATLDKAYILNIKY